MSAEDPEVIRQSIVSVLTDSEAICRSAGRRSGGSTRTAAPTLKEIDLLARRINQSIRELYHALPDYLRPEAEQREPKENADEFERRETHQWGLPSPGGPVLLEVRWPDLTVEQILDLADQYYYDNGTWPKRDSGRIIESAPDTWLGVDASLRSGNRSLEGGTSLAMLLAERRGAPYRGAVRSGSDGAAGPKITIEKPRVPPVPREKRWPALTVELILEWADSHREFTGVWPTKSSGVIVGGFGDNWGTISQALNSGTRTLPGGSSLAQLLAHHRGVRNRKALPHYTEDKILEWCDRHYAWHGRWPTAKDGAVEDARGETWVAVGMALARAQRGLPRRISLACLLEEARGRRNARNHKVLSFEKILHWADAYYDRVGEWPKSKSGPVFEAPEESWMVVDKALRNGTRGITAKGSSLTRLLREERGLKVPPESLPESQILQWAAEYYAANQEWPTRGSGPVRGVFDLKWLSVDKIVRSNSGISLATLLRRHRGSTKKRWPKWTIDQILALADEYHHLHGKWPNGGSGPVSDSSNDTWTGINIALKRANRGLPGGTTLALLLGERRGSRNRSTNPRLDIETILSWADDHHTRARSWPTGGSGPITAAPGETWVRIDAALRRGTRGLPGASSLSRLLTERRSVPHFLGQKPLSIEQVLSWADAHRTRTGGFPTRNSGAIPEAPSEDWSRVNNALIQGNRSLPDGSSLARLLAEHRGKRNRKAAPRLDIETVLIWADHHFERHGRWPTVWWNWQIDDAPDETWRGVDSALKAQGRGLAGCGYRSLAHLLDERRGKLQHRGALPAVRIMD